MIEIVKYGTKDVPLSRKLYEQAIDMGVSFSQLLELMSPTEPGDNTGLDAFERQLARFNIRLHQDPKSGIPASTGALFFQSNHPASAILFPEVLNRMARIALMDETDILPELVASMETINDSAILRAIYIDDTEADRQTSRVGEMGELPTTTINWSEKTTTLKKFGVRIKMSYDFVRRATMPLIQILIGRIMLQRRMDEISLAISVLLSGDGSGHANGAAIAQSNLSTHQGGAPTGTSDMTLPGYLTWLATFYPGQCTTIISNSADVMEAWLVASPTALPLWFNNNVRTAGLPGAPTLVNVKAAPNIRYVEHADIPANDLVGLDRRYGMIGYREIGTDLTETDRIINGQFTEIVMSNTVGFQILFASARKRLNTDA